MAARDHLVNFLPFLRKRHTHDLFRGANGHWNKQLRNTARLGLTCHHNFFFKHWNWLIKLFPQLGHWDIHNAAPAVDRRRAERHRSSRPHDMALGRPVSAPLASCRRSVVFLTFKAQASWPCATPFHPRLHYEAIAFFNMLRNLNARSSFLPGTSDLLFSPTHQPITQLRNATVCNVFTKRDCCFSRKRPNILSDICLILSQMPLFAPLDRLDLSPRHITWVSWRVLFALLQGFTSISWSIFFDSPFTSSSVKCSHSMLTPILFLMCGCDFLLAGSSSLRKWVSLLLLWTSSLHSFFLLLNVRGSQRQKQSLCRPPSLDRKDSPTNHPN